MSEFAPGFVSRHASVAAEILSAAFAPPPGFTPVAITPRNTGERPRPAAAPEPRHFSPKAPGPRHFSPANPDTNPTEGWDPFEPALDPEPAAFVDPIAQARAAGFADGMAAAAADAALARARDEQLFRDLAAALHASGQIDRDALAHRLRVTVRALVSQIVDEAGVSPDRLQRRIAEAVNLIADASELASIRLHPADLGLVRDHLPPRLTPIADQTIARGGFAIEGPATLIEDSPELWLEQLEQALERAVLPTQC